MDIVKLQQSLLEKACPSGCEEKTGELLAELIAPYVDEVYTDNIGNVIGHKKGKGNKLVFAAHRDVIGFMVRQITPCGTALITGMGGHESEALINTPVRFENGTRGIIRRDKDGTDMKNLFIDLGTDNAEQTKALIQVGDMAVFDTPCTESNDIMITPYADDLSGCIALILGAMQAKEYKNDVYFVFTVGEEVGALGASVAAWGLDPDICIAVDVSDALDEPCSEQPRNLYIGGGVSITLRDGNIHCPAVYNTLIDAAQKVGITYQTESMPFGGTDAGSFQDNKGGAVTSVLSIPIRGMHSPSEIFHLNDLRNTGALIAAACNAEFPIFSLKKEVKAL